MADRTVAVRLELDVNPYTRGAQEASKATASIADAGDKSQGRLSKAMGSMARGVGQVTAAGVTLGTALVTSAMNTGIAYNNLEQTSRAAFNTLLGGAEEANAMMNEIAEFGQTSPFPRQLWIQASQQLVGFGLEADKVVDTLVAIQDAAAASGQGTRAIEPIVDVLSRIQSQGRLGGQALQRLGYYGLDAAEIIGDKMGKTADEIRDMASTPGGIPAEEIWDPLIDGLNERFGGAAENMRTTWAGATDRIAGAWRDLSSEIAQPFVTREGGGLAVDWANQFADLLRDIEEKAGPVVNILVGRLSPAFDVFEGAMSRAQSVVGAFDVRTLNDSLDELGKYTPLIAGVGTALVALGVQSIPVLRNVPLLGTNPLLAGIVALVAASPELRGVAVDFITALGPIVPIAQDLAMQLADVAMEVLGTLAPALDSLAQAAAPVIVSLTQALAPALSSLIGLAVPLSSAVAVLADWLSRIPTPVLAAAAAFMALRALNIGRIFTGALPSIQRFIDQMAVQTSLASSAGREIGGMGAAASVARTRVSGLGTALKGAFIANPVGIAVTGLAVGLGVLAGAFANNAQKAAESEARIEGFRATLDKVTGAVTEMTRQNIFDNLFDPERAFNNRGLFTGGTVLADFARQLDVDLGLVVDAVEGVDGAMEALEASLNPQVFGASGMFDAASVDAARFMDALREMNAEVTEGQRRQRENADVMSRSSWLTDMVAEATDRLSGSARDAAQSIDELARAKRESSDASVSMREANIRYQRTLNDINELVKDGVTVTRDSSGALDENAESTLRVDEALIRLRRDTLDVVDSMGAAGESFWEVRAAAEELREEFVRNAIQLGRTREEAEELADTYIGIPTHIATSVTLDGVDAALFQIGRLQSAMGAIGVMPGGGALGLGIQMAAAASGSRNRAHGGPVFGPGSETSDSIRMNLSHNEHVLSAAEVRGLGGHAAVEQMRAAARSGDLARYSTPTYQTPRTIQGSSYRGESLSAERFAESLRDAGQGLPPISISMPASARPADVAEELLFALRRAKTGGVYA